MKKLILLAIILLLPTATYAFTDNSSAPPANNTPLPLNTSSTAQTKVGPLISNSYMQADVFYDRYNSGYYLQPRGTNRLNYIVANNTLTTGNSITNGEVQGAFFRDRNDGNFYVDPNNTSRVNSVLANNLRSLTDIRAPRFIDENNTGLYIDPSSSSFITDIYANRMYDRNNSFFYTDPNTTSVMHSINTYLFRDLNDGNFYVDPNGWSLLRNLQADIVYDRNNTGYYIDPAGTSRMNYVVFNNTYTYGTGNYDDVYIRKARRWASQLGGASYQYRLGYRNCGNFISYPYNQFSCASIVCPSGFYAVSIGNRACEIVWGEDRDGTPTNDGKTCRDDVLCERRIN